jgi:hypothetical protein
MPNQSRVNLENAIPGIAEHYETEPWTENMRSLREDFDISSIKSPSHYVDAISEISEFLREARVLFIYSVFNVICREDGVPYPLKSSYTANQEYTAVMRKDGCFYLRDEDGAYRDIFTNEKFAQFVDDNYYEIFEDK